MCSFLTNRAGLLDQTISDKLPESSLKTDEHVEKLLINSSICIEKSKFEWKCSAYYGLRSSIEAFFNSLFPLSEKLVEEYAKQLS